MNEMLNTSGELQVYCFVLDGFPRGGGVEGREGRGGGGLGALKQSKAEMKKKRIKLEGKQ